MPTLSPLSELRRALNAGDATPRTVARETIARANSGGSRNAYIYFEAEALLRQAEELTAGAALYGVPISLKDCFDLAGTVTTAGSRFYAARNPIAVKDSAVAGRMRAAGCAITGKTHLHPLAYGITGQSADYGDALQPRDVALLTGGSSSGACMSVQEGSALAAIGTDTGGSVRVPAALCRLTGYRASHGLTDREGWFPGGWEGGAHLAPSFDTLGLIMRDPRDVAAIAQALFGVPLEAGVRRAVRIGCVPGTFLHDAAEDVLAGYAGWKQQMQERGAEIKEIDTEPWGEAMEIFAAIQAHEAAQIHTGHFAEFEASIAQRLAWGAGIAASELAALRRRHERFRAELMRLFGEYEFLMLPAAPVSRLLAADDHAETRAKMLRYTAPFSLGGVPSVSLPGEAIGGPFGTGVVVAAGTGGDAGLLGFVGGLVG